MNGTMRTAAWFVAAAVGLAAPVAARAQEKPAEAGAGSKPISKAEALEFGKGLADAFMRLDAKAVDEAVDMDALTEAAAQGVRVSPEFRKAVLEGARKSRERDGHALIREFRPSIQAGSVLRATKEMEWEGKPTVVVRMLHPGGMVSYILFLLDRRPDGRLRAYDYYALAAGEPASKMGRRIYLAGAAQANRGIVDRLLGKEQLLVKHIDDLTRMAAANREGRPEEVMKMFDALPDELKGEKVFLVLRFGAAQKLGDDAKYLEVIEDFAKRLPGDPACDFLLIDGYVLQKKPEKSLECIDRLDKFLGGDAYMKCLRANVLMLLHRPDDARTAIEQALADEPDLRPALDTRLNLALQQKRFAEVAEALDGLEKQLGQPINDLSGIAEFADFLASPEGKAWAGKRKPKPDDAAPAAKP